MPRPICPGCDGTLAYGARRAHHSRACVREHRWRTSALVRAAAEHGAPPADYLAALLSRFGEEGVAAVLGVSLDTVRRWARRCEIRRDWTVRGTPVRLVVVRAQRRRGRGRVPEGQRVLF